MHEQSYEPTTAGTYAGTTSSGATSTAPGSSSKATETAKQAGESAKQTAAEVAGTAKEQGQRVAGEVKTQARSVVSDVRQSVTGQVRTGHNKLADGLRQFSDEIGGMGGDGSSPANRVVQQLGDTGRRAADYLQDRGPEGLLDDVQDFARRKPGTFLLAAAAAGFVIGRLGRSTAKAARADSTDSTTTDYATGTGYRSGYETSAAYGSGTTYDTGTTYGTGGTYATGTAPLADPYATGTPGYDPAVGTAAVDPLTDPAYDQSGYPVDPVSTPDRGLPR